MRKFLLLLSLIIASLALSINTSQAVPAYNKAVNVTLPDGSQLTLRLVGDEFFHYKLTTDGYQVVQGSDGYYYYYTPQSASTRSANTGTRASNPSNRTSQEKSYLRGISTGVNQEYYQAGIAVAKMKREAMNSQAALTRVAAPTASGTMQVGIKGIIILAEFQDVKFQSSHTQATFERLVNEEGYSDNGAIGSARDYYIENSLGTYSPTFTVSSIVTLPENREYYGANDEYGNDLLPAQMVLDACIEADSEIDFSQFDTDGDGYIDNVFVFYAGHNEAEYGPEESVWPHKWALYPTSRYSNGNCTGSVIFDGVTASIYSCTSELKGSSGTTLCGISTFAHEFGHVLGLPDFYDCDYSESGGETVGLYNISIMSSGNYNSNGNIPPYYSVLEREILGWNSPVNLATVGDEVTLYPIHTEAGNNSYYLKTDQDGEIFMFESRKAEGWDAPLGTSGFLIYHVDRSTRLVDGVTALSRWTENTLNDYYGHPCARFIESSGVASFLDSLDRVFYPGSSNRTTFKLGDYGFESWNGEALSINITNISNNNGTVTLKLSSELEQGTLVGTVTNQNGETIGGAEITITSINSSTVTYSTTSDENGEYSFEEVTADTYTLSCSALEYKSTTTQVTITQDETTTQNITLEDAEKVTISGSVTTQEQVALSGVKVMFELTSTDYTSDVKRSAASSTSGGKITFSPVTPVELSTNGVNSISSSISTIQKAALASKESSTDTNGDYTIEDLQYGTYTISFSLSGYTTYYLEGQILDGTSTTIDATLSAIITELMSNYSWGTPLVNGNVSTGSAFYAASLWESGDLDDILGKSIEAVAIKVYGSTGDAITANVYLNGSPYESVTQAIGSSDDISFPLTSSILITSGSSIRVEYSIPTGCYVATDTGAAEDGKSNLYSINGSDWERLSGSGISGSFMTALQYNKGSDEPETPMIEILEVSQNSFTLSYGSTDANIESWAIRLKQSSASKWTEYNVDFYGAVIINELTSNTQFDIEIEASFKGNTSSASTTVTTTSTTAPFAAMSNIKYNYSVNDTFYCELTNLSESTTKTVWYLDSTVVNTGSITFSESGTEHTIKCEITYSSGRTETLKRKVLVN